MKATHHPERQTKYTSTHRKENGGFMQEIAALVPSTYRKNELHSVVTLRIYGTSAMNYACIWVNSQRKDIHCNGSGSAGGYGYHRPSAAAQVAINNAGFDLSQPIDGVGDSAMRDAVLALAKAAGYPSAKLHIAHA